MHYYTLYEGKKSEGTVAKRGGTEGGGKNEEGVAKGKVGEAKVEGGDGVKREVGVVKGRGGGGAKGGGGGGRAEVSSVQGMPQGSKSSQPQPKTYG